MTNDITAAIEAISDDNEFILNSTIPTLYHISPDANREGTWQPKQPDYHTSDDQKIKYQATSSKEKAAVFSEKLPDRICVADSIEGCIIAINPSLLDKFKETRKPYLTYYVYSPQLRDDTRVINTDNLTKKELVWDAFATGEWVILTPVLMKLIGAINIYDTDKVDYKDIHPYDNTKYHMTGTVPVNPKWKWIRQY